MRLGWLERHLMNNRLRPFMQRTLEGRQLLRMGGAMPGAHVLEIGCGSGAGMDLLAD